MYKLTDPLEQTTDENNLNKYKAAGQIATKTVDEIVMNMKPGSKLLDLHLMGTQFITNECNKVYKDVKYKGVAFPVCLSVNNVAGHYIPKDADIVNEGDLVKIELGVHIDGFPAFICFTTLVNNNSNGNKINDKRANVMKAVIEASKEIYGVMKPGRINREVVTILNKYADKYECNLPTCNERGFIPGVLSCEVSRYVCDGYDDDNDEFVHRFILNKENPNYSFTLRDIELEEGEVYAVDILMSTGACKLQGTNEVDIFKRDYQMRQELKLKSSRETLALFNKEMFPICLRNREGKVKIGIKECIDKQLVKTYPVVRDKEGEFIARVKFTVIVQDQPILVCGKPGDGELAKLLAKLGKN